MGKVNITANSEVINDMAIYLKILNLIFLKTLTLCMNLRDAIHPSIAKNDKSRDTDKMLNGLIMHIATTDKNRVVTELTLLPKKEREIVIAHIMPARSAEGEKPVIPTKKRTDRIRKSSLYSRRSLVTERI